jgi:serine protease Do
MSDYCDVIRTQGADATMSIEVLRFATEEVLEGQLNGTPLELSFSFAQEFDEEVPDATGAYTEFFRATDDLTLVSAEVPVEWGDVNGEPNPDFGPSLYAAPDLQAFLESYDTPGVIIEATASRTAADIDATLDELDLSGECTFQGRNPYSDSLYTGSIDYYTDCGGTATSVFVLAVTPEDGSYLARLLIQAVDVRDLDAADRILNTFVAAP